MEVDINDYLSKQYYDSKQPGSYSSLDKFYQHLDKKKVSRKQVQRWLNRSEAYTGYRDVRPKFKRPKVIVSKKDWQFDIDVAHMAKYKKENRGYGYFVLVIDILSRYIWIQPLKTLKGNEMLKALSSLFEDNKPRTIRTDLGSEFICHPVQEYLKKQNITHIQTLHQVKASYAERAIKTIKNKISRFMYKNQTHKWIDILESVTECYNNTKHRSIKMSPVTARETEDSILWKINYPLKVPVERKYKFELSDVVKLSRIVHKMHRAYDRNWTGENFIISQRKYNQSIPMYNIKDWNNEPISGRFYENELQKVNVDDLTVYNIEKIIKKRRRNKKSQLLVRWQGWNSSFDTWLSEEEVSKIKNG